MMFRICLPLILSKTNEPEFCLIWMSLFSCIFLSGDILDEYLNETKANPLQMEPALSPPLETPLIISHEKQNYISPPM